MKFKEHCHMTNKLLKLYFLILIYLTCVVVKAQEVKSIARLSFGSFSIDCYGKYLNFEYDKIINPDTTFYNPPKFVGFFYQESINETHNVPTHSEYIYTTDPMTGELKISAKINVNSISTNAFYGDIKSSSLVDLLLGRIFLSDSLGEYEIESTFTINLSSEQFYLSINRCNSYWKYLIKYEINQLKSGDKVFVDFLSFYDPIRCTNHILGTGYWRIK